MKPIISVIVPVYKVEKFLPRCLDSLCNQSLKNIEILLIDDASPDNCGEICEKYASKHTNFRVLHHTENKGLAIARNTGMKNASGDFLMFVDSDDWVHEDFCKAPYECAIRFHADLVMFNYQNVRDSVICHTKHNNTPSGYMTREEAIELLLKNPSVWNKLYRRDLFNGIIFPEGYMFEDTATTYKLLWKASRIFYINKSLYYYQFRYDSISRLKTTTALKQWFEMNLQLYQGLLDKGFSKEKLQLHINKIAFYYCIRKGVDFSDPYYVMASDILQNHKRVPEDFTCKQRVLLKIFWLSPTIFDMICELCRKKDKYHL